MPSIPTYTKCSMLGCKNERSKTNTMCLEHGGRDVFDYKRYNQSERRKAGLDLYQSKQWRQLRQIELSKNPLCAACLAGGIVRQAQHLDHVFPWMQVGGNAFYVNLFQCLCQSCHSEKTQLEQMGICRHYGKPNRDYKGSDYNGVIALLDLNLKSVAMP